MRRVLHRFIPGPYSTGSASSLARVRDRVVADGIVGNRPLDFPVSGSYTITSDTVLYWPQLPGPTQFGLVRYPSEASWGPNWGSTSTHGSDGICADNANAPTWAAGLRVSKVPGGSMFLRITPSLVTSAEEVGVTSFVDGSSSLSVSISNGGTAWFRQVVGSDYFSREQIAMLAIMSPGSVTLTMRAAP